MRGPRRFWTDDRGATVVEYGLICALIFLGLVAGVSRFGVGLTQMLYLVATRAGNQM